MNDRLQQKILMNVSKDTDSGCWLWTGQVGNSGYGKIMIKDENNCVITTSAQRVSYTAFIGPVPEKHYTRSTCHNRTCVNPDHLELVEMGTVN